MTTEWKGVIKPILELYSDRTPGSLVEEKDFSLVWHYRRSEPELGYVRTQELRTAISDLTANLDVGVFEGSKILEIRQLGINKGRAAERWLEQGQWEFILRRDAKGSLLHKSGHRYLESTLQRGHCCGI